ncbi:ABC-2 family transporter protein [Cohnella sp. LGH]|uniref:ABC transporter permease n=1 Tax=Cohnella sp. LGH TaxID=1619153 RepID=UPI001ADAD540|nr:ABC-2 family transporter protein [Cohnella sp. LGH]QTH41189.1 ABC-2 family transporter protein [Cohnella sp. LGH]
MKVKKYISIMKSAMLDSIAYRSAYFNNLIFRFVQIMCMFYIWKTAFSINHEINGFSWAEIKQYLLITYICTNLMSLKTDFEISKKIMLGSVVIDLLRPISFQIANFAQIIGASLLEASVSTIISGFVLAIIFQVQIPTDTITLILLVISIFMSLMVRFTLIFLFSLFCFWTTSINGIVALRTALTNLFSGALIPLSFFPKWAENIALYSPFQSLIHTPASIFMTNVDFKTAVLLITIQVFWFIVIWILGKMFWKIAVRKLTVFGG